MKSIFIGNIPLHSSRSIFLLIGSNILKNHLFRWILWIFKNDSNLVQFWYSFNKVGAYISYLCNIQLPTGRFKPVWIHYGNNISATMVATPYFVSLRFRSSTNASTLSFKQCLEAYNKLEPIRALVLFIKN